MKPQQTHIAVGRTSDLKILEEAIATSDSLEWPVPKRADVGDVVLFLVPAQHGAVVATGTVLKKSVKSERWPRKYESPIGNLVKLNKPVAIEQMKETFPTWGYPKYARGYNTVPEEVKDALAVMATEPKSKRRSKTSG